MNDTTPEMARIQVEIVLGFSPEKRLKTVLDMMQWGIEMTRQRLVNQFPDYTPKQLKFEQIKAYYGDEFSEKQLLAIQQKLDAAN